MVLLRAVCQSLQAVVATFINIFQYHYYCQNLKFCIKVLVVKVKEINGQNFVKLCVKSCVDGPRDYNTARGTVVILRKKFFLNYIEIHYGISIQQL